MKFIIAVTDNEVLICFCKIRHKHINNEEYVLRHYILSLNNPHKKLSKHKIYSRVVEIERKTFPWDPNEFIFLDISIEDLGKALQLYPYSKLNRIYLA